jgi:hypothetical protein
MRHPIPIAAMTASFAGVSLSGVVHAPYADARDTIDQNKADTLNNDMFTRWPGDKAHACFMRRYDAEHLAKHPKQKVAATNLVISADIPEDEKRRAYSFRPSVKYRHRAGDFDSSGYATMRSRKTSQAKSASLAASIAKAAASFKGGVVRLAELQSQGYLYLRP